MLQGKLSKTMKPDTVLSVRQLKTYFHMDGTTVKAVDGVSFDLARGATLGIVGESGSGKSACGLSILRLIPSPPGRIEDGEVVLHNIDLLKLSESEMRKVRGKRIAMIFQDPMTSLNPFMRVGAQVEEVLRLHEGLSRSEARSRALDALARVGIARADDYPHQLSGGMRQRVMIAMALACNPEVLIADEPTTALDVTIQAQILELIQNLNPEGSRILITHDLGVVAGTTNLVAVMYAGRIVEYAPTGELFARPLHPYTQGLLKSIPDPRQAEPLYQIPGLPPDLSALPAGCPFAPRCPRATEQCQSLPPAQYVDDDHYYVCWLKP